MSQKKQTEAIPTDTLAESENYLVWLSDEPDGETVYHVELGSLTLHFFREEWEEVVALISGAVDEERGRHKK